MLEVQLSKIDNDKVLEALMIGYISRPRRAKTKGTLTLHLAYMHSRINGGSET